MAALTRALAEGGGEMATALAEPVAAADRTAGWFAGAKWGLLATMAILAAGGLFLVRSNAGAPPPSEALGGAATSLTTVASPIAEPRAAQSSETATPDAIPVALLPEAPLEHDKQRTTLEPASRGAPSARPIERPVVSSEDDLLAAEVRALERVRAAIAERRVADARAGLASYERAFPKKLLASEARVLEIEVLLADGRREEAETLARAFLASSPDSPYATRVRSLVARPRLP